MQATASLHASTDQLEAALKQLREELDEVETATALLVSDCDDPQK